MNEGIALTFDCKTTSPFHTTRQQYSNLAKCAPFILGSTLRGAILARLIERETCPHIAKALASSSVEQIGAAHRACENPQCPIKPFFPEGDPRVWFSFGAFKADTARLYRAATRIALERETSSVAEGAIVTIESITPDTPFTFSVTLFGEAMVLADDVEWAVEKTAQTQGIGRFRSIGYGQFAVEPAQRASFAQRVADEQSKWQGAKISAKFATPYIIGNGKDTVALERASFTEAIQNDLQNTLRAVGIETPLPLQDANLILTPEYVSRFSYEQGGPQHRLVAWEESGLSLTWAQNDETMRTALAVASLLGMGEWRDCGFGQIRLKPRDQSLGSQG